MWLLQVLARQEKEDILSMTTFLLLVHQMNQKMKNVWEFRKYCTLALLTMAFQSCKAFKRQILNGCLDQYCLIENICALAIVKFPFCLVTNTIAGHVFVVFLTFTRYCYTCKSEGVINNIYYLSLSSWSCCCSFTFMWFSIALPPIVWLHNAFLNC